MGWGGLWLVNFGVRTDMERWKENVSPQGGVIHFLSFETVVRYFLFPWMSVVYKQELSGEKIIINQLHTTTNNAQHCRPLFQKVHPQA